MTWLELSVEVPWEYAEPISYLFNHYGRGLSIEDPEANRVLLRTYLRSTAHKAMSHIDIGVRLVSQLVPGTELRVTELKQEDWETAWKAHFSLLRIGQHLVIRPSWVEYQEEPEDVVIDLDPGMAFGTGYHPTTRMCLTFLERRVSPGMIILDLGTGSGILAVAAFRLGAAQTIGIDVDPIAVKVARSNCRANGLGKAVTLLRGSLPHDKVPAESCDMVVANISAKVIQEKANQILRVLRPGGTFTASGVIRQQAPEVANALASVGFGDIDTEYLEDWACITANRRA